MTAPPSRLDFAYQTQRLRLNAAVVAAASLAWSRLHENRDPTLERVIQIVSAGQQQTATLAAAYMDAKSLEQTGHAPRIQLDPAVYTTELLRGIPAAVVYGRPFGALNAFLRDGAAPADALRAAQASVGKLAATDLQLAQTHAARDWIQQAAAAPAAETTIVGYRRVLTGPGPHCKLCEAASTRTYRADDLMPIHEHCTCTVQPLWGTEPVASIGTTVRVELDPELGPRLLADDWSTVGPRLID